MSQTNSDAIDVLSQVIVDTIDKKLDSANFDKSQTGVVTAVNGNQYTIAVFGSQYTIISDQVFTVGQSVVVTALQGDMKRLVCSPDNIGTMKTVDSKVNVVSEKVNDFIGVDFADTIIRFNDISDQIDGSYIIWFKNDVPTLDNSPANEWTTDAAKKIHVGDLYYNKANGTAFKWISSSDIYGWEEITDENVLKVFASASKDNDAVDGKRRIFYTTPTTPYDKGDVWARANNDGFMLICQTARAITDSYNRSDWVVASKYTDDTVANKALDSATNKNGDTFNTFYDSDFKVTKESVESCVTAIEYSTDGSTEDGGLKKKLSEAESKITQNATAIESKVSKDGVISSINQTPESVTIDANKINLQGQVTISDGKTIVTNIDGGVVTTGKINAQYLDLTGNITIGSGNKKVEISDGGVKVFYGNNIVQVTSGGVSISDGSGSCSINSGAITFHGIKNQNVIRQWSYSSAASTFSAQTISLNLSGYSAVMLVYDTYKSGTWFANGGSAGRLTVVLPVNGQTYSFAYPWNTVHWRTVAVSTTGITFGTGQERKSNYYAPVGYFDLQDPAGDGVRTNDQVCRPCELYGFM